MNFTEYWTKQDNDYLRKLIKEHKSPNDIISIMGREKLEKNPKKKYIGRFSDFILDEIYAKPKKTHFTLKQKKSNHFSGKLNYNVFFNSDSGEKYILDLVYVEDSISPFPDRSMYNISFTIKNQYNLDDYLEYEKDTNRGELLEVVSRLIYILSYIDVWIRIEIPDVVYIIGETENPQKINIYRDIIKNSLKDYHEIKGNSSINLNKPAYYYFKTIDK